MIQAVTHNLIKWQLLYKSTAGVGADSDWDPGIGTEERLPSPYPTPFSGAEMAWGAQNLLMLKKFLLILILLHTTYARKRHMRRPSQT